MITTEQLNLLWLERDASDDLRTALNRLFDDGEYQRWYEHGPREPFSASSPDQWPELQRAGLLNGQHQLEVKVNRINGKIFITDGAWVSHRMRVFPDPDEAMLVVDFAASRKLGEWADWLIDPAAGCGHSPIGFEGRARRISCDANARAVVYAALNARINGLSGAQFMPLLNDMRAGLPPGLKLDGNVLFVSNVPFAPAPRVDALVLNSGGGPTGADLQKSSFAMVKEFQQRHQGEVRACFVTWTVGSASTGEWEVPGYARDIFSGHSVEWSLVQHEYDAEDLPNPSPLRPMLMHLAQSQYAVDPRKQNLGGEYTALANELEQRGFTHMAYGVIDCRFERSMPLATQGSPQPDN